MQYSSSVNIDVPRSQVIGYVSDLGRYQLWMPLIHAVEQISDDVWSVELRAKVGVFARSKRLTMHRTFNSDEKIVFERRENDGREHAPWVMQVSVAETQTGCNVEIDLSYGGKLWTAGVLDKILANQVDLSKKALVALVTHL